MILLAYGFENSCKIVSKMQLCAAKHNLYSSSYQGKQDNISYLLFCSLRPRSADYGCPRKLLSSAHKKSLVQNRSEMSPQSQIKVYLTTICLQNATTRKILFCQQCFKEPQAQKRCFRGQGKTRGWSYGPQHLLLKQLTKAEKVVCEKMSQLS